MLNYKLPIHFTGLAMALLAGAILCAPVHAQTVEDDTRPYSDRTVDDGDVVTDEDADATDEDDAQRAATADSEAGEARRADDGQDLALSEEERRCVTEFRSFDPATGIYVTEDGDRERCPYLF